MRRWITHRTKVLILCLATGVRFNQLVLFSFFCIPIYRAKGGTYVTRTIGCFVSSIYVVPRCVPVINLAVTLALGGHNLFWAWYVWVMWLIP